MNYKWVWYCPICGIKSKKSVNLSGRARRNGRSHLKSEHNDYETEPIIEKIIE